METMLSDLMKTVLDTFDADRAWSFYPSDPNAPTFRVPIEVSRSEYPDANTLNKAIAMRLSIAEDLRAALAAEGPWSIRLEGKAL